MLRYVQAASQVTLQMQNTWFTADPHLGWKNALTKGKRPFSSVEEMDAIIINNWNTAVIPNDIIYVVGDFAIAHHTPYLSRLMGQKILIPGNHDHKKLLKKAEGWHSIEPPIKEIKLDGKIIVLCHYKMATWNRSHYGTLHLYGHSHGGWPGDSQSCDVGTDCWDYKPISLGDAMERMKTFPKRKELDHHQPEEVCHASKT